MGRENKGLKGRVNSKERIEVINGYRGRQTDWKTVKKGRGREERREKEKGRGEKKGNKERKGRRRREKRYKEKGRGERKGNREREGKRE